MNATTRISPADTAKLLRVALKKNFPGTTFSVRTKTYAGGASIDVSYTDGAAYDEVEAVAQKFAGASFDGMQDLMEYHTSTHEGQDVRFGANFVFVNRNLSIGFLTAVVKEANYLLEDFEVIEDSTGASLQFDGEFNESWTEFLSIRHNIMQSARSKNADFREGRNG